MIYLAQSDTTAGFLSHDESELNRAKNRAESQKCVITTANFLTLKNFVRVPEKYKNLVRRAKKTSFLCSNSRCVRVVKDERHAKFLQNELEGWAYSTSANAHNMGFDKEWAKSVVDKIFDEEILQENPASKIYKLGKTKIRKIR